MKDNKIDSEIKIYNITDAWIAEKHEKYLKLKVKDASDNKSYAIVHKARIEIKDKRVSVEKRRKELKKKILEDGRIVDGEAKRISGLLSPIEDHLVEQEKIVEDEKERIEEERKEKAKKRIEGRIILLRENKMVFDGIENYIYEYQDNEGNKQELSLSHLMLVRLDDMAFEEQVDHLRDVVVKIEEREKLKKEQQEEIEKEQRREADRLTKEKKEQEKREAKIKEDQEKREAKIKEEIEESEKKVREGLAKIENEKRKIKEEVERKKQEEERKREVEEEKAKAAKEAEIKIKIEQEEKEEKEEVEREKTEKAEKLKEQLRPDNEKLMQLAVSIEKIEMPSLKNKKSYEVMEKANKHLEEACGILRQEKSNAGEKND